MVDSSSSPRWSLVLPAVALVVGVLLTALASLAGYAFGEREALALDGRILGLVHDAELEIRKQGEAKAPEILEALWDTARNEVRGIALVSPDGVRTGQVGAQDESLPVRRVVIFVGPQRDQVPRRGQRRGWRTMEVYLDPAAGAAPASIRYLPLAAALVAIGLVALAVLGGRLLERERRHAAAAARGRRLEALGRAGAGLAHQLRTPLATIKGSCQLLEERLEDAAAKERAAAAVSQADRMDRMLATLLDYARPPAPEPRPVALAAALADLQKQHANLRIEAVGDTTVCADPEHLLQMLENLVGNATAHSPDGGLVEVSSRRRGQVIELRVSDRGPGPGDDPEKLFEPYVTSRTDGTGLGLPIARALAEAAGGTLHLEQRDGGGCVAVLTLPLIGCSA